jgi:hypothetical protein
MKSFRWGSSGAAIRIRKDGPTGMARFHSCGRLLLSVEAREKTKETLSFSDLVQTVIVKQGIEPIFKALLLVERVEMTESLEKGFLAGVLCVFVIHQHIQSNRHGISPVFIHEDSVRLGISLKAAFHKIVIAHVTALHYILRLGHDLSLLLEKKTKEIEQFGESAESLK